MEVLFGFILGVLVTILLQRYPITVNINTTHKEIIDVIEQPDLITAMNKPTSKDVQMDEIYSKEMSGLVEEINKLMMGGDTSGRKD